jgi:FkbM family methyltransferase
MKVLSIEDFINGKSEIEPDLKILFREDEELQFLDIGSCTGEDSILYANQFPKASIIAFEPLPKNVEVLRQHLKKANKENCIHIESFALSDDEGSCTFYVSGGSPYANQNIVNTTIRPKEWNKSSSLLKPSALLSETLPWLTFSEKIVVETKRLDNYLGEKNIKKIDFIHLDVQGAELKVLVGLGKLIRNVKAIWLEVENVELYENQPLRGEIINFLKSNNFYLVKDTSTGNLAGDCLFVNGFSVFLRYRVCKVLQFGAKLVKRLERRLEKNISSEVR